MCVNLPSLTVLTVKNYREALKKTIKDREISLPRWFFINVFLQYKKEFQGELKGSESQILIKKGYNEYSIGMGWHL